MENVIEFEDRTIVLEDTKMSFWSCNDFLRPYFPYNITDYAVGWQKGMFNDRKDYSYFSNMI